MYDKVVSFYLIRSPFHIAYECPIFIEPVVFRLAPNCLSDHFRWVKDFYLAVTNDLLPRSRQFKPRKSGWVESHKTAWHTRLARYPPTMNAVGNNNPVSSFRSFFVRLGAT